MHLRKGKTPDGRHAEGGFGEKVRSSTNSPEYSFHPIHFQASWLIRRFSLSAPAARVVAELAFGRSAA